MSFKIFKGRERIICLLVLISILSFQVSTFLFLNLNQNLYNNQINSKTSSASKAKRYTPTNSQNNNKSIRIITPENKTYSRPMKGYYPGTYGFEKDSVGSNPTGWEVSELEETSVQIINESGDHKNVVELYDNSPQRFPFIKNDFLDQNFGIIEFWYKVSSHDPFNRMIYIWDGNSHNSIIIRIDPAGKVLYFSGNVYHDTGFYLIEGSWHHFRIEFDCSSDWHLWIDGNSVDVGAGYGYRGTPSSMNSLIFYGGSSDAGGYYIYVDAVGYSWDPDYNIGDNLNEGLLLSFERNTTLNWMGYSLDDCETITILGNKTIPMPTYGIHTIQVFGIDSFGTLYHSEKRIFSFWMGTTVDQYSVFNPSLSDLSLQKDFMLEWYQMWGRDDIIDELQDIEIDSLGNVYLVGNTFTGNEIWDIVLIKYNPLGIREWEAIRYRDWDEKAYEIAIDSNDNIYIAGSTFDIANKKWDMLLLKYYSNGTEDTNAKKIWDGYNENDEAYSIALDSYNNFYLAGYSEEGGTCYVCVVKYDSGGNYQWVRRGSSSERSTGVYIGINSFEHIYIAFTIQDRDGFKILRYDSSGTLLKTETYNYDNLKVQSLAIDSFDNIYITGQFNYYTPESIGSIFLRRYDYELNSLQGGLIIPLGNENGYVFSENRGNDIICDPLGYFYVIGHEENCLWEFEEGGDFLWADQCTINGWEKATCIGIDISENLGAKTIYVGGEVNGSICLLKYHIESNGYYFNKHNLKSAWSVDPTGTEIKMVIDHDNNIIVLAQEGSDMNTRFSLSKYNSEGIEIWYEDFIPDLFEGIKEPVYPYDVAVDSENNIYVVGAYSRYYWYNSWTKDVFIAKFSKEGEHEWFRYWGSTPLPWPYPPWDILWDECGNGIAVDSNDNIYVISDYVVSDTPYASAGLIKYDSDGNFIWVNEEVRGDSIAINSYNYIFVLTDNGLICCSSDNGAKWWENPHVTGKDLAIDSNNEIYVVGDSLSKINILYGIIYEKGDIDGKGIAIDSNDNLYIIKTELAKYTKNGKKLWGDYSYGNIDVAVDSRDYVYTLKYGKLRRYTNYMPFQIQFSVRENHQINVNSKLSLSLSNFYNPYDNNYFLIETEGGSFYEEILLPRKNSPANINIEIPIYLDKLTSELFADGCLYNETLIITLPHKEFDIDSFKLIVEDKFTQEVPVRYDKKFGYIDFGLDVSTYLGTAWKGSKVEVHMPKIPELKNYYGLDQDAYLDQLWSVDRVEVLRGDGHILTLPNGFDHEAHTFYFYDLEVGEGNEITEAINWGDHRIYFNKKSLGFVSFVQKPDSTLGYEIIQTNKDDFMDYSLYCKAYDPNPILGKTAVPYFMNSTEYEPHVEYFINIYDITIKGNFNDYGINIEKFIWNLDAGHYDYSISLENVLEPVYNTELLNFSYINFYEQPFFEINPEISTTIMDERGFTSQINLTSPDGVDIGQLFNIYAENAYWDAHDENVLNYLSSNLLFENFSGNVYHYIQGKPSSSEEINPGIPATTILSNLNYPNSCLIATPEILEYNPITNFTEQQLEIQFVLDLSDIIIKSNLDPSRDFSFLRASIFGSSFIDLSHITNIDKLYGKLQIYNSITDKFDTFKEDYIVYDTLEYGNLNNSLKLEQFYDYVFNFSYDNGLSRFIDPQNRITFRLLSYFKGNFSKPNEYLSLLDKPNSVLGALLEYVNFEVISWKNNPVLVDFISVESHRSPFYYNYIPTYPGVYNITFEFDNNSSYYLPTTKTIEIKVERRPVRIELEVPEIGYSTGMNILNATVIDETLDIPAIDAKVVFHSIYNGIDMILGEAYTNTYGIATLTINNLEYGTHSIWAETVSNNGKYSYPYENKPFTRDKWAPSSSKSYLFEMILSESELKLISLAPEGYHAIVNQSFYVYPKLIDLYTKREIYNYPIKILINSEILGKYYSSKPFLITFNKSGELILEGIYEGSNILNSSKTSISFYVKRLSLSFVEKSPEGPKYFPDQILNVTVLAFDLATQNFVPNLNISLYSNMSDFLGWGFTKSDGTITFTFKIPINWVSKEIYLYAINAPEQDLYLEQYSDKLSIEVYPFNCSSFLYINETELFAEEYYNFTFQLWNYDLQEFIDDEPLIINIFKDGSILPEYLNTKVITSYNNSLIFNFSNIGFYEIEIKHLESDLYMRSIDTFSFEIIKRPTRISINITDKDLVPGNEFSITVNLIDTINNHTILNKFINVSRNIYVNDTLVESKNLFKVNTQYTKTFAWIPYRSADFEFLFSFDSLDSIYQNSYYSIMLNVRKRHVLINSLINGTNFKVGNIILINSTFNDLNTTNSEPISSLKVHYLILDGENTIYSNNFTTNYQGIIEFEWQIPSNLANKSLKIIIITANTNYYHWNYRKFEISTTPLETYFNIIIKPNPKNYVNEEILFLIELFDIQGEEIEAIISYEISCENNSYYNRGIIDLKETSLFSISLSEVGKYKINFYYNVSEIYGPATFEIIYYIELRPSSLKLMEYPDFIYPFQQTADFTYQLVDLLSQVPLANNLVQLYYFDLTTIQEVLLGQNYTDENGFVNIKVDFPEDYIYDSIIFIVKSENTSLNDGTTNSVEILITKSPTYINIKTIIDSFQFYIGDILNITFELYDYFINLLDSEVLNIEIITPNDAIIRTIYCNQILTLNFTELGLYKVNITYFGSDNYLPSTSQVIYAVSPIPTILKFIELIPDTLYPEQSINLKVQLKNNISQSPIEGELINIYISNESITKILFSGITDGNGIISYPWEITTEFVEQYIQIYAKYDITKNFENCSTEKFYTYISKYDVELVFLEFPHIFSPLKEENFEIKAIRKSTGEIAVECHLQMYIIFPNGTYELIKDVYTNIEGKVSFSWIPPRRIFNFGQIVFEINIIETDIYHSGLFYSDSIPVEKMETSISIIPEKTYVLINDTIEIRFGLKNIFNESLTGQIIDVSIVNIFNSFNFEIMIGLNDTYEFFVPSSGIFEIIGHYKGNERNYESINKSRIFSEKLLLHIDLSIVESFTKNKIQGFRGFYWNFSVLDGHEYLTLIANITIKDYNIPIEGAIVCFYYQRKSNNALLLGSNITNSNGIALFKWNVSNFKKPKWWISSVLYAVIEENEYFKKSESDPIYCTVRKIFTYITITTFTPNFHINVEYRINVSIKDEFSFILRGLNLIITVYEPKGKTFHTYNIISNESSYIQFTPKKLGNYKIEVIFTGTPSFHRAKEVKHYKCIGKEPTAIRIILPDIITPYKQYTITIELINSTGALILGEFVSIELKYHDESSKTEVYYLYVIIGVNSTFDWIFPEYDEYKIKVTYSGSDIYEASTAQKLSKKSERFILSYWELLILFSTPILPTLKRDKSSGYSKRKRKLIAFGWILIFFGATYAGNSFMCSQTTTTGLIKDLNVESLSMKDNLLMDDQNQGMITDLLDYGNSKLQTSTSNIKSEWIPNLVNESAPYDKIIENSTIIPPEVDNTPPILYFTEVSENQIIGGTYPIEVYAFDGESGIKKVLFKLHFSNMTLGEEGEFIYNESINRFIYRLDTNKYDDGDYDIYAIALDNNNNSQIIYVKVKVLNNPTYDLDEFKLDNIIVELTDYINVVFTSVVDGEYNVKIIDAKGVDIDTFSGIVSANQFVNLKIPIEPLYYREGNYRILISVASLVIIDGFPVLKTEVQSLNLFVIKESVKLELDIIEEEINTDRIIHFRARLIENDGGISEGGTFEDNSQNLGIPGQVLLFKLSDKDNYQILGKSITDGNGYASIMYKVDLTKGPHTFNVSFEGNNIYKPLETFKLFENQGLITQILLNNVKSPVAYNDFGSISVDLKSDLRILHNNTLYFNISNSYENIYLGMARTDLKGTATIEFPCNFKPGYYDIIVSYDGDTTYAKNVTIFRDRLEVIKLNTSIQILNENLIPYKYDTELAAKLVVKDSFIGIEGIPLIFELIDTMTGDRYNLGESYTDFNGYSSVILNPYDNNFTPNNSYYLNVFFYESVYHNNASIHVPLKVKEDVPIISVEGTEVFFLDEFSINATLTDSLLNPLIGKKVNFYILNHTDPSTSLKWGSAITNKNGVATFTVPSNTFYHQGSFDIEVQFSDPNNNYEDLTSRVENALIIFSRETHLYIYGPEQEIPIKSLEIELFLADNRGVPIAGQQVVLECYRGNSSIDLLGSGTMIRTNSNGSSTYSLPLLLPGEYLIRAYFRPQSDNILDNDGFMDCAAEFEFKIVRIPADLSVKKLNLPKIMRGDVLDITMVAESEVAKDYIIPVRLFVDGCQFKHKDVLGELRFIYHGKGVISYKIPLGPDYQAGIYNFTIEIEEEGSIFKGSTSFLIDLVERTTLSINYKILNQRAEGKHYIWEPEKIIIVLLDEDGKPLPDVCSNETVNRFINYQIINGKNVYGKAMASLINGSFTIHHKPESYGYETCTAIYNGSRFFAPAKQKKIVEIFRRPLFLHFLDYYHNNPERSEVPHTGHRGETLYIEAKVQDYLNLSFLKNHEVFFGYNGKFLGISNISDEDGKVTIEVFLSAENGLIQAGLYNLNIKIFLSEKFQSVENQSIDSIHKDKLYIFEICSLHWNIGDINTDGMNFVNNPTIYLLDEDNQIIDFMPFYLEVYQKDTKRLIYAEYTYSGKISIPTTGGGEYDIICMLSKSSLARSEDPNKIAQWLYTFDISPFVLTLTYISSSPYSFTVIEVLIITGTLPIITEIIGTAFVQSIKKKAEFWTCLILLFLAIGFGYFEGKLLEISFTMLFKFFLCVMIFAKLKLDVLIRAILVSLVATPFGYYQIFKEMKGDDFLIRFYQLGILLTIPVVLSSIYESFKTWEKKKARKEDVKTIGVQVCMLLIYGLIKFIIKDLGDEWALLLEGGFNAAWLIRKKWDRLFGFLPMGAAIGVLLGTIIIFIVVDLCIQPMIDDWIKTAPEPKVIWKPIYEVYGKFFKTALTFFLMGIILVFVVILAGIFEISGLPSALQIIVELFLILVDTILKKIIDVFINILMESLGFPVQDEETLFLS